MTTQSSHPDIYQAVTDRIIALLEQGTAPWKKPWSSAQGGAPKNLVSKREYSGINWFMLGCQGYEAPYWLTFKQAKERGGHVRKGEKGSLAIFWKAYQKESENDEEKPATIPVLRHYTVFNVEQCEGVDYPREEIPEWPENERINRAETIQLCMPRRPHVVCRGGRACYSPIDDTVTVPELKRFEKPEEYYSALFHELAHSTGHESRLAREGITNTHFFGDELYSKEELIAEMTSAFICAHCGIDTATIENSAAYIQGWIKALKGDKKLAITAGAAAQKAANYILNIQPEN